MSSNILKGREFDSSFTRMTLGEFFFNTAEKYTNRISQIDGDLDKSETYGSIKQKSVRLALSLQKKGVTSKHVICFCAFNSLDDTIAVIGSCYLGAKIVNLDPTLSARNTQYLLTVAKPNIIFVEEEAVSMIENALENEKLKSEIIVFGDSKKHTMFDDLLQASPKESSFKPVKVDLNEVAVMFFSSGTTGLPKAICHTHSGYLQFIDVYYQNIRSVINCMLHYTTFYWISGFNTLFHAFMDGDTRVFAKKLNGTHVFKMIEKYKVTSLFVAPIYTYELTKVANPEQYDTSAFQAILMAGTSLSSEQYKKLMQIFPNSAISSAYGMTECGLVAMFDILNEKDLIRSKRTSVGKVAPGLTLKIVNPDTGEVLGPNQKGEFRIKCQCMMNGYYRMDSWDCYDRDGYLKTGDIGHYDEDQCLYIDGRIKEMFKYLSWHIVPTSIESVISEHPAVKEVVVFGLPKDEQGEVPAACVVLHENKQIKEADIEQFVEERVSDKEKLRGGVLFVKNLPKTVTGKLIRNDAKNLFIKSILT